MTNKEGLFGKKNAFIILKAFLKITVAAYLRGMRPTPSTKEDTLMLREWLKL